MHKKIFGNPFTIIKGAPEPLKVKSGKRAYLSLEDGRTVMDCISSWWDYIFAWSFSTRNAKANLLIRPSKLLEHVIICRDLLMEPAEQLVS